MFPSHVETVEDGYFLLTRWLERDLAPLAVDPEPVQVDLLVDASDVPVGIKLSPTRLHVARGVLTAQLVVGEDLDWVFYSFDFRIADRLIWRHDRHPGHEAVDGTDRHLHTMRFGRERRRPVDSTPTLAKLAALIFES